MTSDNQVKNNVDVNFLVDQPSETDFFGSHSQVADAVADAIGKAGATNVIGLLGGWGSGKSTVVRQIAARLKVKPRGDGIHLFTYDAWLHQNDPPRRAFLEELIGELTTSGLVDADNWGPRLAALSGRSEETITETTRHLTKTGKWIFLSLGLVPLGLGFLDFDLFNQAYGPTPRESAKWLFWLSLLLLLAPVLVVTGFYVWWRPFRAGWARDGFIFPFRQDFWTMHDAQHADESILSLLTNQSTEISENKTKISPEPTAIEFRSVFNDLLKALSAGGRKLVIVIDNLDRLAEHEAMQLWATIRSLFLGNNRAYEGVDGLKPPTIILPIDEAAIVRMFASTHDAEGEAERLAESFNEKTFDIAFHVNEPVMSDWRAYLNDKLRQAFGEFATDERAYWITKIVEEASAQKAIDGKITPRKIIKLINAIGALLSQWGREPINVLTMAFYVAHRSAIAPDVPKFLKGTYPKMDAAAPEWRRELVALHFGVPPEKAYQALLSEPLTTAIGSLDVEKFSSLVAVPGAPQVIEELVEDLPSHAGPGGPDANFVANAAILIGEGTESDEIWARRTLEELSDRWINAPPQNSWRTDYPILMKCMSPRSHKIGAFLAATGEKLGAAISTQRPSDDIASAFATAVASVREAADSYQHGTPKIPLSLAPSDLLDMLTKIAPADRPAIRTDKTTKEVVAEFERKLSDEAQAENLAALVRLAASPQSILYKDGQKFDWDPLVQKAHTNVNGNDLTHFATGPSLDVLGLLYTKHANSKALADAHFDSGRLSTLLNEADRDANDSRFADIAAIMFLRGSDFAGPNGSAWADVPSKHVEFVNRFKTALHWYCWGNAATYVLREQKGRVSFLPIVQQIVKDEVENEGSAGIPTSYVFTNLEAMERYLGPELITKAITDISRRTTFWTDFEEVKIGRSFNRIVLELLRTKAKDKEELASTVRNRLDTVDLGGWRDAVEKSAEPLELIKIYRDEFGKSDPLGDELKAALSEQLPALMTGSSSMRRSWFTLSAYVSRSTRVTLYKNLRDRLLSGTLTDSEQLSDLMLSGGSTFTREGKFGDEPDKVARHIVSLMLISEDGWNVIEQEADFYAGIVERCEADTRAAIDELLAIDKEENIENEARLRLRQILKLS